MNSVVWKSMGTAATVLVMTCLRTVALTAALSVAIGLAALATATRADAGSNRLEVGFGYQDVEITDEEGPEPSVGTAVSLAYWRDGLGTAKNTSVGVELLYLGGSSQSETFAGTVSGTTFDGTFEGEPTITALMFNIAWRHNDPGSRLHPYIGLGAGIARVRYESSFSGLIDGEPVNLSVEDEDTAFMLQGFLGVDYDLGDKWYVGADVRWYGTSIDVFEQDVNLNGFALTAKLGMRF